MNNFLKVLLCAASCAASALPVLSCSVKEPSDSGGTAQSTPIQQADFFPNPGLWKGSFVGDGFYMDIRADRHSAFSPALQAASVSYYGMGGSRRLLPEIVYGVNGTGVKGAAAEEWGWSITHLDGKEDGAKMIHNTKFTGVNAPKTRREAVEKIWDYLNRQYIKGADHPWFSMNHHYPWHHYAGEMGFDILGSELGENVNNYQWHIALTRGAARQYNTPWVIQFSAWHGPSITDFSGAKIWGADSSPDGGHSMNLLERTFLISLMSGADYLLAEAGALIAFYREIEDDGPDSARRYKISPYGEVCRKINQFALAHPEITRQGDGYAPIGIVLDYYHGAYAGVDSKKAFFTFAYNQGDTMTWNLIDMIWPKGWLVQNRKELGAMVNGPYGDNFDVLLQNASQEALNSYPALVLSGDVKLSPDEIARYKKYVKQGGILLLNTAFVKSFPEFAGSTAGTTGGKSSSGSRYDKTYGKGRVIVYGPDYQVNELGPILDEIIAEKVPFTVSKNIEYMLNIRDGCIYVTLINNDGVTKEPMKPTVIDEGQAHAVTVTYNRSAAISPVEDIYNHLPVSFDGKTAALTIPAGGMAVLEFRSVP